jgi:glycosyltransferase involved in cell wall biosynthesis
VSEAALLRAALPPGEAPLLLHVFPTFEVGGAQVRFAAIANRFGARWRHAIVSLDGGLSCGERLSSDVPWAALPFPPRAEGLPNRLRRIRAALGAIAPARLVTSNWGSIEWALANLAPPRSPHLHMEDGFGPEEVARQIPRRVWTRVVALRVSTVLLPSTGLLRAARAVWRLPERRLRFVPNGLDLARFAPSGPRAALDVPGEGPLIGTVAALRAEKNLARLIEAFALLRGTGAAARLLIAGDGPERPGLEALTARLGIADRVVFAGHWPDPAALYRACDIFALSSDTEQMPFSILEAMASGLPVAATDVGDVGVMVAGENRPLVVPKAAAPLAGALGALVADHALRARLGAANRAKAERDYDQETMFAAHAALWGPAPVPA